MKSAQDSDVPVVTEIALGPVGVQSFVPESFLAIGTSKITPVIMKGLQSNVEQSGNFCLTKIHG